MLFVKTIPVNKVEPRSNHVQLNREIKVISVRSQNEVEQFAEFPFSLYKDNPFWVPPLKNEEVKYLYQNPAAGEYAIQLFLAYRNGKVVGRVAGFYKLGENEGFQAKLGWLDFVDDHSVSQALLWHVETWTKVSGMESIKGPYGFSSLDKLGILTKGFEEEGTCSTSYNAPYYAEHLQRLGYTKENTWVEYELTVPNEIPEKISRLSGFIQHRGNYRLIPCRSRKQLRKYRQVVFDLLLKTYQEIPSYEKLSPAQIQYYIQKSFKYIQPGYVSIAVDNEGETVGFAIVAPSISQALMKAKGKLNLRSMWELIKSMRKNTKADFYLIGVLPEHQNKGIPILFIEQILKTLIRKGIEKVETNPELKDNYKVQMLWKFFEKRQHKTRSTFQKMLD